MAKHGKTAPVVEKAPKAVKVPRKVADKMLADGWITQEKFDAMIASDAVTTGGGSGTPAIENLILNGMDKATAETLETARKAFNDGQKSKNSLWRLRFVVQEMKAKDVEAE